MSAVTREVIREAEEWAVEKQFVIRWYHAWDDRGVTRVTAYAEDERGEGQCLTMPPTMPTKTAD